VAELRGVRPEPSVLVVGLRGAAAVPIVYMDTAMIHCGKQSN